MWAESFVACTATGRFQAPLQRPAVSFKAGTAISERLGSALHPPNSRDLDRPLQHGATGPATENPHPRQRRVRSRLLRWTRRT